MTSLKKIESETSHCFFNLKTLKSDPFENFFYFIFVVLIASTLLAPKKQFLVK